MSTAPSAIAISFGTAVALLMMAACTLTTSLDGYAGSAVIAALDGGDDGNAGDDAGDARTDDGASDARAAPSAAAAYRAAVLADGPVAYYRLADPGGIAADELGMHDGVYAGQVSHGRGVFAGSGATTFDGASYVDVGDDFAFLGVASFSLEAWVSTLAPGSNPSCLLAKDDSAESGGASDGYALFLGGGGKGELSGARFRDANQEAAVGSAVAVGPWVHLVMTYDGTKGSIALYANGNPVAQGNSASTLVSIPTHFTIGASRGGNGCFFRGSMSDAAVYDRALTAAQVQAHHAAGTATP